MLIELSKSILFTISYSWTYCVTRNHYILKIQLVTNFAIPTQLDCNKFMKYQDENYNKKGNISSQYFGL